MSTESSGFKTVYTETMPSKQACLECDFDIPAHEITGENGEKTGIFEIYDELSKSFARCKIQQLAEMDPTECDDS